MTIEDLVEVSKQNKVFIKVTSGWDDRANTQYIRIHLRKGDLRYNIYLPEGSQELSDVQELIQKAILQIFSRGS